MRDAATEHGVPERILRTRIRQQGIQTYRDQKDARRILLRASDVPGIFEPKPIRQAELETVAA